MANAADFSMMITGLAIVILWLTLLIKANDGSEGFQIFMTAFGMLFALPALAIGSFGLGRLIGLV